jgi:hypothetical protein
MTLAIDDDQKDNRLAFAEIHQGVRHIGPVTGGVAGINFLRIAGRFDAEPALLQGQEFTSAFEMRRAAQRTSRLEADFVELDILLEVQRREGTDLAIFVRSIVLGMIIGPNHGDA